MKNSDCNIFQISYEIKEKSDDNFLYLNFKFEDNSFNINISYFIGEIIKNSTQKNIDNSTSIYLSSDFLVDNDQSIEVIAEKRKININISNYKTGIIHFKIIEKNSICLLKRNALNFGFLTTKTKNQYYYTEIFNEEEGELMLHNKRFYGELYGKIIIKDEANKDYLNISKYPFSSNDSKLEYSPHYLKLKYTHLNTSHCSNGCYLLITYQQIQSEFDFPSIGYEFTILSRTWNYSNYLSEIIDIPFNEFIISCFDQEGTQNHYYSIYVPNESGEIIIEVESNYLDFFYDEERKKINTINPKKSTKQIDIDNNKAVFSINTTELNLTGKYISFALRPKSYYNNIFSFYYFRALYFKEKETKYYPIDSYLGNLCKPEFNNDTNYYYCNFILRNDYNESNTKFAISSINQYEHPKIYISKIFSNKNISNVEYEFRYINNNKSENISYYIFQFEFTNDEIKNIISTYEDKVESIYPQIYSSQMFYISGINQTSYFKNLKYHYYLTYQYLYGTSGNISFLNIPKPYYANRNYIGIPVTIPIDNEYYEIVSRPMDALNDLIYYNQLFYNNKSNGIEEIKIGEPKNQIINECYFPIYFYLNLNRNRDINILINIRLQNQNSEPEDDIEIKGYLLDYDIIRRKQNGEYIKFPEAFNGYYSSGFNIGYLQVIQNITKGIKYLLVEIGKKGTDLQIKPNLLVNIVAKDYINDVFWPPLNNYFFDTFIGINNTIKSENRYLININRIKNDSVLVELSTIYDDIEIIFDDYPNIPCQKISGFKKYRIDSSILKDDYNIYFSVRNSKEQKRKRTNYMIRYYYTNMPGEYEYHFDGNFVRTINETKENNDESVDISLKFKHIMVYTGEKRDDLVDVGIIYFIITGILYKSNEISDKSINTTSMLTDLTEFGKNETTLVYDAKNKSEWYFIFTNYSRNKNGKYELQLKIKVNITDNLFNEEFLVFKTSLDLSDIELEPSKTWIIYIFVGIIILALIIIFIIKYNRLRKKNTEIQQEMKSVLFSNDIQKNALFKEKELSKSQSDYETTFI